MANLVAGDRMADGVGRRLLRVHLGAILVAEYSPSSHRRNGGSCIGIAAAGGSGSSPNKSAGGSSSAATSTPTAPTASSPKPVSHPYPDRTQITQILGSTSDNLAGAPGLTYRTASCQPWAPDRQCRLTVWQGDTLYGSEHESVEPMFPAFKGIFAFPKVKSVIITVWSKDLQTLGGKTVSGPVVAVNCTRTAANQINWDNLSMDGPHALCAEQRFITFQT